MSAVRTGGNPVDLGQIDIGYGTPCKAVIWYSKGFLYNGSHFFDLAKYWFGPVQSLRLIDRGRSLSTADREPDVRVVFARGTAVFFAAQEDALSHYTVEFVGPSGRLRCEQGGERIELEPAAPHPRLRGYRRLAAPEQISTGMPRYRSHVINLLAVAKQRLRLSRACVQ